MKRILFLFTLLVTIILTAITALYIVEQAEIDFLYHKAELSITFDNSHPELKVEDFYELLHEFSYEEGINISQYQYSGTDKINIFSTNIKEMHPLYLEKGTYPKEDSYLQNYGEINQRVSGIISFPNDKHIRIYNMSQVKNVGYDNNFYIDSYNSETLNKLKEKTTDYGMAEISIPGLIQFIEWYNPLLLVIGLLIILILFVQFYAISQEKKKLYLYQLWGYGKNNFLIYTLRKALVRVLSSMIVALALYLLYSFLFNRYLLYTLGNYLLLYLGILICVVFVTIITVGIMSLVSRKKRIDIMQIIVFCCKFATAMVFMFLMIKSINVHTNYKDKISRMNYWEQAKDIYRINVNYFGYDTNDLKSDDIYNQNMNQFFTILEKEKDGFILDSGNFFLMHRENGTSTYTYMNIKNTEGNEFYSSSGISLKASKNYFKFNPIVTPDNINVTNLFESDSNTLNIIVPEQLQEEYEGEIIKSYEEYFYFYKVHLENMYREEIGLPLSTLEQEDLSINIIYAKEGSEYFTYNSNTGSPNNNKVKDAIVIIFDGKVHTSEIGSYGTRCMYFIDDMNGDAYTNILPYMR